MPLTDWMWVATAAYGLHVLEEYQFNWRDWARSALGLPVAWSDFYVVNALMIVLGIVAAHLAAAQPVLALAFPALMLINATFFHVLPFAASRGHFSPGLVTAVVLFYPVGLASYARAVAVDGIGRSGVLISLLIGALLMASPVVMLKVKDWPYFRQ